MVLRDLRQRQDGFDGQTGVAEQRDVAWRRRDEGQQDMDDEEAGGEVGKELVVAAQSTISSALFLAWEKEKEWNWCTNGRALGHCQKSYGRRPRRSDCRVLPRSVAE